MKRVLGCALALLPLIACAEDTKLGLYLMGTRIGTATYSSKEDVLDGAKVKRSDSATHMNAELLGQKVNINVDSSTWSNDAGRPLRMTFSMSSAGRNQTIDARFGASQAVVQIDNSGTKTTKTLDIPKDAPIVDDPLTELLGDKKSVGVKHSFFVLDPTTVSFVRNDATFKGASKALVFGKDVPARLIEIVDPRATLSVYVDEKGDLVKADGPLGMEMIPDKLLSDSSPPPTTPIDLATISSIGAQGDLDDPDHLSELKLQISGKDMSAVPSDDHQTVKPQGRDWIVDIHPPKIADTPGVTLGEAARMQPKWTKPSLDIPSDSPRFKKLAAKIIGRSKRVRDASLEIRAYVHSTMHPNAGIGVVRNANEVLSTKEGVCRDYAILTATLLRAAGIPARLASGLEAFRGRFYYHAWAEAWDGKRWIGVDSTVSQQQISAGHVKLASGLVEDAFTFPVLDKVKIRILSQSHAFAN